MGQLVRLKNATAVDVATNVNKYLSVTQTNGTSTTLSSSYTHYTSLAVRDTWGTTHTESGTNWMFPYATSNSTVDYNTTSITNQIGTCAVAYTVNSDNKGYTANITITGSGLQDETVNSIFLTRKFFVSGGSQELLLHAYILDNPITLNAGNNYTANLTMSVSFE